MEYLFIMYGAYYNVCVYLCCISFQWTTIRTLKSSYVEYKHCKNFYTIPIVIILLQASHCRSGARCIKGDTT